MYILKKTVLALAVISIFITSYSQADDNKFTIVESGDRTFLLDTETGANWRYYFNNGEQQGWQQTTFYVSSTETEEAFTFKPYGEIYSVKKPIKTPSPAKNKKP